MKIKIADEDGRGRGKKCKMQNRKCKMQNVTGAARDANDIDNDNDNEIDNDNDNEIDKDNEIDNDNVNGSGDENDGWWR